MQTFKTTALQKIPKTIDKDLWKYLANIGYDHNSD